MARIILISGLVGAGKSTYAREMAISQDAMRFSIDEWMSILFQADWPEVLEFNWSMERIARIEKQIWSMTEQLVSQGKDVIFDLGLLQKEHRENFYNLAAGNGFSIETHIIEADMEIRWQRVQERNAQKGETFSLDVNREMFDFCENLYERPEEAELDRCQFIRTDK